MTIHYGIRLGCRFGQPHEFTTIKDTKTVKVEKCRLCQTRRRWQKRYKGRIDNKEYLKDHVREFAQKTGPTHRVFKKLYEPEKTVIYL